MKVVCQFVKKQGSSACRIFMALMCSGLHLPLLGVVDSMIMEVVNGPMRHFTLTCCILVVFSFFHYCTRSINSGHDSKRLNSQKRTGVFAFFSVFYEVISKS